MIEPYYDGIMDYSHPLLLSKYSKNKINLDKYVFDTVLRAWINRPQLVRNHANPKNYGKQEIQVYDALLWYPITLTKDRYDRLKKEYNNYIKTPISTKTSNNPLENTNYSFPERSSQERQEELNKLKESINTWKYTGKIYRVMDCKPHEIEYHNMIASWTKDPESFKKFQLCEEDKYTFLIGKTSKDWSFDINKYCEHNDKKEFKFIEHESEIIFPMSKKHITDTFYGTLDDFYEHINENN